MSCSISRLTIPPGLIGHLKRWSRLPTSLRLPSTRSFMRRYRLDFSALKISRRLYRQAYFAAMHCPLRQRFSLEKHSFNTVAEGAVDSLPCPISTLVHTPLLAVFGFCHGILGDIKHISLQWN